MNPWLLSFLTLVDYGRYDEITVDIGLFNGDSFIQLDAKLDTGSKFCVFQPSFAAKLDLDL